MSSIKTVLLAILLGGILGFFLQEHALYLKPLGDVFIKLIKMIIVPLIFFAIISGMTSSGSIASLKSVGLKAMLAYLISTIFAVFIGFASAHILAPGNGIRIDDLDKIEAPRNHVFDFIAQVIPDNAIGAMASGNILQVVFFAIFTGYCLLKLSSDRSTPLIKGISNLTQLVFQMVTLIVKLAPLAAFAFTAWLIGTQGLQVVQGLAQLILAMLCASFIQYCVFGIMIIALARVSPLPFFKKSLSYQAIAFSTTSTKAALVPAMKIAEKDLGVSHQCATFVLPLGATINMTGLAIYLGLCAVFIAQAIGKVLGMHDYFMIIITSTLGSIGGAGIPGAAIIMLPMVLSAAGLPVEGIALIAGIDRIMDMLRSTISITGDVAIALCVDKELDKKQYFS